MGAAFKLTDAIDESIVRKLRTIGEQAETTATSYAKLAVEMGKMQGVNPKGIAELEEKASKYNETIKELRATQQKLNELQNQQKDIYAQVAKQIQEQVKHEKEKAKLEGQMLTNESKRLKNQQLLERQNRKTAASQEDITRALNEQAKTMRQASEQNRILRQAMRDTDLTAADAAEKMEMYNRKIMENEELLDKNSDAMIQRKRNIGNYASAWNGLGMSVQQLARELPSLSMGFNTFFLAISNNLPILADEIKRARIEFQAMKAAGEKATPVWKQLAGAIFNWQTALVVGITVLSMYGKEIIEWGKNLFKGEKQIKSYKETLDDVNNSFKDNMSGFGDIITKIKALRDAWKDLGGDLNGKKKLIGENKALFDELGVEVNGVSDAEKVLVKYTSVIIEAMTLRAKATEAYNLSVEQETLAMRKRMEAEKAMVSTNIWDYWNAGIDVITNLDAVIQGVDMWNPEKYSKARAGGLLIEADSAEAASEAYRKLFSQLQTDAKDILLKAGINLSENGSGIVKAALDIDKELAESRIALIQDDRARELAENTKIFEEKLSQIKGNSEKEMELRENLAKLQKQREEEINKKYNEQKQREEEEAQKRLMQERINNLDKYAEIEAINLVTSQITANQELEDEYKQGLINREEYEREKFELQKHYNEMALRNSIETAKAMINLMPDGADKDEAIAKLRKQMAELNTLMSTEFEGDKDKDWASKSWQEKWSESIEFVSQAMNGVVDIVSSSYDAQIQKIEEEQEKNEEAGQKELERIQELADKGVITTEEAEARKRAAEEKTAKKNEELERKKAALQTKQAKLEKAANIASVIMNTAVAIMKAWGQVGIFGAPMAALIGAMGAIQLATIVAQPIPKYAKGTDSHKGGLAVVGDGGVRETVITDKGMYLTPNTPTLVNLPKGAQVIPYVLNMDAMKANASDIDGLMAYRKENELPPITIENDYSGLQRDIKRLEESQRKGFKTLAKAINNQDYKRFAASI